MVSLQSDKISNHRSELHGDLPSDLHLRLWDLFADTAKAHPDRDAVVSLWQSRCAAGIELPSQTSYLRWTYGRLVEKASHLAASLATRVELGGNKKLAVLLWNSAEWALFFWASAKLGTTFVALDPRDPGQCQVALESLNPKVVVVQDEDGAAIVDKLSSHTTSQMLRIQCSPSKSEVWADLSQLMAEALPQDINARPEANVGCNDQVALIIYTSGTGGLPKGCPHIYRSLVSQTQKYDFNADPDMVDRWLVHTPISHIFAINNALRAWRYGEAIVFPSRSFDVSTTIDALVQEQCTIMSATPTLARALVSHPKFPNRQDISLNVITIAGTNIMQEDIDLCRQQLGAADAIQAYGMSEGAPLASWSRADKLLVNGYHPGVGKVLPGASIKVCVYGSQKTLNRNEVGELHVGGPSVITSYVSNVDSEAFYESASQIWLKTGDEAMIDSDGVLHILGRYKDLIIRGGENIHPTKIEAVLNEIPGLQVSSTCSIRKSYLMTDFMKAHVIPVPDPVAGQVPAAVVKLPDGVSKRQVHMRATSLGPSCALAYVYTLEELGLDVVPTTSLGKVKKQHLAQLVRKKMVHEDGENLNSTKAPNQERQNLEQVLSNVWQTLIGVRPSGSEDVSHMADSITMLRYCDAVLRATGNHIYLQDLTEHNTIDKQVQLLQSRSRDRPGQVGNGATVRPAPKNKGTRSVSSVSSDTTTFVPAHVPKELEYRTDPIDEHEPRAFHISKSRLMEYGLDLSAIEDVMPIRAAHHRMAQGQRPQAYHNRTVFRVAKASSSKVQRALEKALLSKPMFRSVLLHSSEIGHAHVILKPSHEFFDDIISHISVRDNTEASKIWQDDPATNYSLRYTFHATIIRVEDSEDCLLSLTYNHTAMDALSLLSWHQELDRTLEDFNASTMAVTSYRYFCDLFYQYEESVPATRAVRYHVAQLRGISRLSTALWPPRRAPGSMISSDTSSTYAGERATVRNKVWNDEWDAKAHNFRYPRLGRIVYLPSLTKLKAHGIEASLFARCAVILLNVLKTGSSYAIFNTWEAARRWPFVPKWIEATLPPAMSIDGPTVEWILNMFEVVRSETVMEFFRRMVLQKENLSRHEHVPWQRVVQELRDEGEMAIDASFRQSFVWDMSLGIQNSGALLRSLKPIARLDWADW